VLARQQWNFEKVWRGILSLVLEATHFSPQGDEASCILSSAQFLIDKQGNVTARYSSISSPSGLQSDIETLLDAPSVSSSL
jgi:hypothetical protein